MLKLCSGLLQFLRLRPRDHTRYPLGLGADSVQFLIAFIGSGVEGKPDRRGDNQQKQRSNPDPYIRCSCLHSCTCFHI